MSNELINFNRVSAEVFYPSKPDIVQVCRKDIDNLIEQADQTERKRARICAHAMPGDGLHEMLIVHEKNSYIRPHKHLNRSESFHIVWGIADIIVFDDEGSIVEVVKMGDFATGRAFFYRLNINYYHSMLIRSDRLVFHESTLGPFHPESTVFAAWAPQPSDSAGVDRFMAGIEHKIHS